MYIVIGVPVLCVGPSCDVFRGISGEGRRLSLALGAIEGDGILWLCFPLQAAVYSATFPVFDKYRKTYFVGEMVWNFADFETAQGKQHRSVFVMLLFVVVVVYPGSGRADGNKKGVLTRERQPKLGAWVIRTRYHNLAGKETGSHPQGNNSSPLQYCHGLKCEGL